MRLPPSLTYYAPLPLSVAAIRDEAFFKCSLEHVTIPASVREIGFSAFAHCHDLKSAIVPTTTTLHEDAFYNSPTTVTRQTAEEMEAAAKVRRSLRSCGGGGVGSCAVRIVCGEQGGGGEGSGRAERPCPPSPSPLPLSASLTLYAAPSLPPPWSPHALLPPLP